MIITKTPLRLEFLGGSTDIKNFYQKHPGHILNTTIDKYIYVSITSMVGSISRLICNGEIQTFKSYKDLKNPIVMAALKMFNVNTALDIIITADIDLKGSGLGSSSSLAVGLINALASLQGKKINREELAEMACSLEIDILKSPVGKQDQYASSFGGFSSYTFNKNGKVDVVNLGLDNSFLEKLNDSLLVFYTGMSHSSSEILRGQNKNFNDNFEKLKAMGALVKPAVNVLKDGDIESFAKILEIEWTIKKKLGKGISSDQIEKMYSKALESGALGGRLSGAGGGGYLFVFAPITKHKVIIDSLKRYRLFPVRFTNEGSLVFIV